jgi:catechol 2,3-dioxygenase-like lactoylglutathione lyase family enzyme
MVDRGLTHVALPVTDLDASLSFYEKYAGLRVVHQRRDAATGDRVAWISDGTRPFVVVLIEAKEVRHALLPIAHLGVGCASREEVDRLAAEGRREGRAVWGPTDSGYPVGYWALLADPDHHTLELAYGQEVALAVEEAGLGQPEDS